MTMIFIILGTIILTKYGLTQVLGFVTDLLTDLSAKQSKK